MLDDLFKPYTYTINAANIHKATYSSYRLRCSSIGLDNILNWSSKFTLEMVLKPVISKLISVLSNGSRFVEGEIYNEQTIVEFIDTFYVKLTPDAKLDSVLEYISKLTFFDGQAITIKHPSEIKIAQMYFYNIKEWNFYLNNAITQNYVLKKSIPPSGTTTYSTVEYSLTVNGLSRLIQINEGRTSRYCFIAMAFIDDMFSILENAIKPALKACAFEPRIVSEEHIDSDKTINDAILAGIKKARFTIADFTHHRGGVYFEAGYALGRGQKVIYTCRHDHMDKAHFDIRNYQHIVWTDAVDFKKQLINKIEAFIID